MKFGGLLFVLHCAAAMQPRVLPHLSTQTPVTGRTPSCYVVPATATVAATVYAYCAAPGAAAGEAWRTGPASGRVVCTTCYNGGNNVGQYGGGGTEAELIDHAHNCMYNYKNNGNTVGSNYYNKRCPAFGATTSSSSSLSPFF